MPSDSRERMVRSAAALIAGRGVSGTSFSDVLADSGAPRGSIYHHFPEGKEQLAHAAIDWTSDWVLSRQRACAATEPVDVLDCFVGLWRLVVQASDGASGCAVAGVALDSPAGQSPALMAAVREAFRSWTGVLAEQLVGTGVPRARAQALAVTTLATLEGSLILCRAEGGTGPLDVAAGELRRLFTGLTPG